MIIADPASTPLTHRKWERHLTLVQASGCDVGSLATSFLAWPGPRGPAPRVPRRHCGTGKRFGAVGFSDTGVRRPSDATLIRRYPDCTPRELAWYCYACCTVEYLAFCAELSRRPP